MAKGTRERTKPRLGVEHRLHINEKGGRHKFAEQIAGG